MLLHIPTYCGSIVKNPAYVSNRVYSRLGEIHSKRLEIVLKSDEIGGNAYRKFIGNTKFHISGMPELADNKNTYN